MAVEHAHYHAHVYYEPAVRTDAERLHRRFADAVGSAEFAGVIFVGEMRDESLGPHPQPQFEVHFLRAALPAVTRLIETSGLTALVHPLTDDDLADHTTLAEWIGTPLPLDHSVLDPPGMNQAIARFGKSDF